MVYPQANSPRNARVHPNQEISALWDGTSALEKATDTDIPVRRPLHNWLHQRQDYIQYWISHGGNTAPIPQTYESITNHNGLRLEATTSLPNTTRKADSVIHSASNSEAETVTHTYPSPVSNLLERAIAVRHRLDHINQPPNVQSSEESKNSLVAIRQDIHTLLLDVARSVPHQQPRLPQTSRIYGGTSQPQSSGSYNAKQNKTKGKQPVQDTNYGLGSGGEASVKVRTPSGKAKKVHMRCIYYDAANAEHSCPATKPFVNHLIKHLQSHHDFFCYDCSQCFRGPQGLVEFNQHRDNHVENRFCIDIECDKIAQMGSLHRRLNGCEEFKNLGTWRKYRSLFARLRPGVDEPAYEDVFIDMVWDEMDIERDTQYASTMAQEMIGFTGLGGVAGDTLDELRFADTPAPDDQPITYGQDSFLTSDGLVPENASDRRLATMQQQQNAMQATIDEQNARLDRQATTIQELRQIIDQVVLRLNGQANNTQFVNMADIQRQQY